MKNNIKRITTDQFNSVIKQLEELRDFLINIGDDETSMVDIIKEVNSKKEKYTYKEIK